MANQNKIVWLASYPKSGNTWFRAFLSALLSPEVADIDINNLYPTTIASSRQLFDEITGVSSADLTFDEIEHLRPFVYRRSALDSNKLIFHKIHDAWTRLPDCSGMFPKDVTKIVFYFIRNPLDIAVSFAAHLNTTIDIAINIMNDPKFAFCDKNNKLNNQLRQKLFTWSIHVKSWVDESDLTVKVLRYEDMKNDPIKTFSQALELIDFKFTMEDIKNALRLSSFEKMKKQENEKGFLEKNAQSAIFFRKGIIDDWKSHLSINQVNRIVETHKEIMFRFGYIDKI